MKYLYILFIGIVFINCSDKSVEVVEQKIVPDKVVEVLNVKEEPEIGAIEVVESASVTDETLVADERKVIKKIQRDVPKSCAMWSDGCNVCTRTNSRDASCTTYPECHNRVLSCLQWN